MKSSPFVVACTFLLGALVSLMAIQALRQPVTAASSSGGNGTVENLNVVTVKADGDRELLVVFKNVKNSLDPQGATGTSKSQEPGEVTGMAVYDIKVDGQGKAEVLLAATRFVDYDCMIHEYSNKTNSATLSVEEAKKAAAEKKPGKKP